MCARICAGVRVVSEAWKDANESGAPRTAFGAAISERRHGVSQHFTFGI